MNLPNKLTIGRMCAIPIIIVVALITQLRDITVFGNVNLQQLIILILFCSASFTDFLDGHIARKYNLVTNFGKFMDPLADKLLVLTALIYLIEIGKLVAFGVELGFAVTIILAREFAVTGLRLLAANNNCVIAASKMGKSKTVSQMFMIIILLLNCYPFSFLGGNSVDVTTVVLISIATILTIVSGIDYFVKNISVFKDKKEEE